MTLKETAPSLVPLSSKKEKLALSLEVVVQRIQLLRGHKVMLDHDLADLYEVPVKRLKEQVRRNRARFPDDFLFELTVDETERLASSRSQNATLKRGTNTKYGAFAFTEQGVAMLSGVLHSQRAIDVNVAIMRAFVRMRQEFSANQELARKLEQLENKLMGHDYKIQTIVQAIRALTQLPEKERARIGYKPEQLPNNSRRNYVRRQG